MNGPATDGHGRASAAAAAPTLVSQELYDETLLENADAFDLSPEEAVAETTEQLVKQCSRTNLPSLDKDMIDELAKRYLGHLFLSHPETTKGRRDRSRRGAFLKTLDLDFLDGRIGGDGGVSVESDGDCDTICDAIDSVRLCLSGRAGEVIWSKLKFDLNFEIENNIIEEGDDDAGGGGADDVCEGEGDDEDENGEETEEEGGPVPTRCYGAVANDSSTVAAVVASRARAGLPYLTTFEAHGAIFTLMSLLGCNGRDEDCRLRVMRASARCLGTALRLGGPGLRDSFCAFDLTRRLLRTMLVDYIRSTRAAEDEKDAVPAMDAWRDVLAMATAACRRCEKNKVVFMRAGLGPKRPPRADENSRPNCGDTTEGRGMKDADVEAIGTSGVDVLLSTLSTLSSSDEKEDDGEVDTDLTGRRLRIETEGCRLQAALCRYDDFRSESSSAVEHAMAFHRAGAVPVLMRILNSSLTSGEVESEGLRMCRYDLSCASMAAVRVLAVNDDIVQSLVAAGLLKSIPITLQQCGCSGGEDGSPSSSMAEARGEDRVRLLVATLGTIRNLCGNDDIKTTLCNDGNTLPSIVNAMSSHPDVARVQEHGCATLAAMALRKPENALSILREGGADRVIVAMKRHPTDVPLQRQGCLAVRNVASRAGRARTDGDGDSGGGGGTDVVEGEWGGNAVREALLELGVESVLRDIAGRHRGSVDEAYAALRDLGCEVTLVQVEVGPDGTPLGDAFKGGGVQMFGDVKPKFRHTFEESGGDGVGLMNERIARHAAASSSSSPANTATRGSSSQYI